MAHWERVKDDIYELSREVEKFDPQVIAGVPRGGAMVAILLSYLLKAKGREPMLVFLPPSYPFRYSYTLTPPYAKIKLEPSMRRFVFGKRVVVVEDGICSSKTSDLIADLLERKYKCKVMVASITLNTLAAESDPDTHLRETRKSLESFVWRLPLLSFLDMELVKKRKGVPSAITISIPVHGRSGSLSRTLRMAATGRNTEYDNAMDLIVLDGKGYTITGEARGAGIEVVGTWHSNVYKANDCQATKICAICGRHPSARASHICNDYHVFSYFAPSLGAFTRKLIKVLRKEGHQVGAGEVSLANSALSTRERRTLFRRLVSKRTV